MTIVRVLPALLCALLAACGSAPTKLEKLRIVADAGVNEGWAVALDIVFVYDAANVALLPKTGPEWFTNKKALRAALATGIDVVELGVPATTTVDVVLPKRVDEAIGVYSFANYIPAAGQPAANLTPYKTMTIRLTPVDIVYTGK